MLMLTLLLLIRLLSPAAAGLTDKKTVYELDTRFKAADVRSELSLL